MENVRNVGNSVVAVGLSANALLILLGALGIAFLLEIGLLMLFVFGVLMVRGLYGDNGAVGTLLWVAALGLAMVLLFLQPLSMLVSIIAGLVLLALAITKKLDLW